MNWLDKFRVAHPGYDISIVNATPDAMHVTVTSPSGLRNYGYIESGTPFVLEVDLRQFLTMAVRGLDAAERRSRA